jgi:hypothetical protein
MHLFIVLKLLNEILILLAIEAPWLKPTPRRQFRSQKHLLRGVDETC